MGASLNSNGMNLDYSNPTKSVTTTKGSTTALIPPSSCKVGCMFVWQLGHLTGGTLPGGSYYGVCQPFSQYASGIRVGDMFNQTYSGSTYPFGNLGAEYFRGATGLFIRRD